MQRMLHLGLLKFSAVRTSTNFVSAFWHLSNVNIVVKQTSCSFGPALTLLGLGSSKYDYLIAYLKTFTYDLIK